MVISWILLFSLVNIFLSHLGGNSLQSSLSTPTVSVEPDAPMVQEVGKTVISEDSGSNETPPNTGETPPATSPSLQATTELATVPHPAGSKADPDSTTTRSTEPPVSLQAGFMPKS